MRLSVRGKNRESLEKPIFLIYGKWYDRQEWQSHGTLYQRIQISQMALSMILSNNQTCTNGEVIISVALLKSTLDRNCNDIDIDQLTLQYLEACSLSWGQ